MRLAVVFLALAACGGAPATKPGPKPEEFPPLCQDCSRYIIGGDSRNDAAHVLPWAFQQARMRKATAFMFLGDMELTGSLDEDFEKLLPMLGPIPFYPVLGNHEVKTFGFISTNKAEREARFRKRFLDTPRTPVHSSIHNKVVYSTDLPNGVHFVALDNVSQKGFGEEQLAWLKADLESTRANAEIQHIIVGMHKALAKNGVSTHAMDEDGEKGVADSDAALALFVQQHVTLIVASHVHQYMAFTQAGIPSYITGGLGAPLSHHAKRENAFHHFLQVDVGPNGLQVSVVRFDGGFVHGDED